MMMLLKRLRRTNIKAREREREKRGEKFSMYELLL